MKTKTDKWLNKLLKKQTNVSSIGNSLSIENMQKTDKWEDKITLAFSKLYIRHSFNEVDEVQLEIKRLFSQTLQEIKKKLKKMERDENSKNYNFGGETHTDRIHNEMRGMDNIFGYNQALSDIIKILEEYEKAI